MLLEAWSDGDGDGFGASDTAAEVCALAEGQVDNGDDCDDDDPDVHPEAQELCNEQDDDCDGLVDDEDDSVDLSTGETFYADTDGDSHGDASSATLACAAPADHVADDLDCDDTNPDISPSATEVCNGYDDNCDGMADDEDAGLDPSSTTAYHDDSDGDTFGDPDVSTSACLPPDGTVLDATDCDDTDETVYPGAEEVCGDGVVNDCDGSAADAAEECGWSGSLDSGDAGLALTVDDNQKFAKQPASTAT